MIWIDQNTKCFCGYISSSFLFPFFLPSLSEVIITHVVLTHRWQANSPVVLVFIDNYLCVRLLDNHPSFLLDWKLWKDGSLREIWLMESLKTDRINVSRMLSTKKRKALGCMLQRCWSEAQLSEAASVLRGKSFALVSLLVGEWLCKPLKCGPLIWDHGDSLRTGHNEAFSFPMSPEFNYRTKLDCAWPMDFLGHMLGTRQETSCSSKAKHTCRAQTLACSVNNWQELRRGKILTFNYRSLLFKRPLECAAIISIIYSFYLRATPDNAQRLLLVLTPGDVGESNPGQPCVRQMSCLLYYSLATHILFCGY